MKYLLKVCITEDKFDVSEMDELLEHREASVGPRKIMLGELNQISFQGSGPVLFARKHMIELLMKLTEKTQGANCEWDEEHLLFSMWIGKREKEEKRVDDPIVIHPDYKTQ